MQERNGGGDSRYFLQRICSPFLHPAPAFDCFDAQRVAPPDLTTLVIRISRFIR